MSDAQRTPEQHCMESVSKDGWHFHLCGKKAKFVITSPKGTKGMRCASMPADTELRGVATKWRRYERRPDF